MGGGGAAHSDAQQMRQSKRAFRGRLCGDAWIEHLRYFRANLFAGKESQMPNPVVHFEIIGKDGKALQDFYRNAFGWNVSADNPMDYGIVEPQEGQGIGGGISAGEPGSDTSRVTFYIEVDDPDAYLRKIESLGGKIITPTTEIPDMVIFAMFSDPEGNVLGLTKAGYPPEHEHPHP
jgi:predicted enzyme related to lactoylglutathione lyase